jgi:glutathione S-transferase
MKLYVTYTSPYERLARIVVVEKGLEDRVEILEAKTRTRGSPYYQINPSGRVPYLVDDAGIGIEYSQLICAYLDNLDGKPRLHQDDLAIHIKDRRALNLVGQYLRRTAERGGRDCARGIRPRIGG